MRFAGSGMYRFHGPSAKSEEGCLYGPVSELLARHCEVQPSDGVGLHYHMIPL